MNDDAPETCFTCAWGYLAESGLRCKQRGWWVDPDSRCQCYERLTPEVPQP